MGQDQRRREHSESRRVDSSGRRHLSTTAPRNGTLGDPVETPKLAIRSTRRISGCYFGREVEVRTVIPMEHFLGSCAVACSVLRKCQLYTMHKDDGLSVGSSTALYARAHPRGSSTQLGLNFGHHKSNRWRIWTCTPSNSDYSRLQKNLA